MPSTARARRPVFRCTDCGWATPRWAGRCGECHAWSSLVESAAGGGRADQGSFPGSGRALGPRPGSLLTVARPVLSPARPVGHVVAEPLRALPTGVGEVDRVLGGGLVPGSVVLLAGEPGIGKSTLLLDLAARWARRRSPVLYVTAEESAPQVRLRAERIEALDPRLFLVAETELGAVLTHAGTVLGEGPGDGSGHVCADGPGDRPGEETGDRSGQSSGEGADQRPGRPGGGRRTTGAGLLVLDSVQAVSSADLDGPPGGVAQVREVAGTLIRLAKSTGHVVVLVGHVTKDGSVAGPRTLEHLVDVVLEVGGERTSSLRVLRAVKNRYGSTEEIGCFDLSEGGVVEVPDPSGLFLSHHRVPVSGTCVSVAAEGTRPIVAELQALVAPAPGGAPPRRTSHGLDPGRVAMVLAVLQRRAGLPLHLREVFAATVGGVRVPEPAVDLAIALAVAGAAADVALAPGTVAIGEIGLAGELRPVPGISRRLGEAARLGFTTAYVPAGAGATPPAGLRVHEFADLLSALAGAGLGTPGRRNRRSG